MFFSLCLLLFFITLVVALFFAFIACPHRVYYFSSSHLFILPSLRLLLFLFVFTTSLLFVLTISPFYTYCFRSLHLLLFLVVLASTPLLAFATSPLCTCCYFSSLHLLLLPSSHLLLLLFALDASSCLDFVIWNVRYEMDISVGKYSPMLKSSI